MTIASQLKVVRDALREWAAGRHGGVEIAADPEHLFALLQIKPGGFRAVVIFQGETKRGEYEELGFVDRTFWVVLSFGRSMMLDKGNALVTSRAGNLPLFDLVEECRELIRGISFEEANDSATTEITPNFKAIETFDTGDLQLDAYRIIFTIGCQLPAVVAAASVETDAEPTPEPVAPSLSALRLEIPVASGSGSVVDCVDPEPVSAVMQGTWGVTWDVAIRIAGLFEGKSYAGGSNDGAWLQTDGEPAADSYNTVKLEISDPPATYWLNRRDVSGNLHAVDYTATFRIKSGATVTLTFDSVDGRMLRNYPAREIEGVEGILPDLGQFIDLTPTSYA